MCLSLPVIMDRCCAGFLGTITAWMGPAVCWLLGERVWSEGLSRTCSTELYYSRCLGACSSQVWDCGRLLWLWARLQSHTTSLQPSPWPVMSPEPDFSFSSSFSDVPWHQTKALWRHFLRLLGKPLSPVTFILGKSFSIVSVQEGIGLLLASAVVFLQISQHLACMLHGLWLGVVAISFFALKTGIVYLICILSCLQWVLWERWKVKMSNHYYL